MTREEAIQILADLIDSPFLHTWEKQNKALHMAIEALSAPQTDLINRGRADAIEAVAQQWLFEASVGNPYVNDDDIGEYRKLAEELFEDVPSADAVSREFYKDAVKANIRLVIENRKLKEQLESAEAEWISCSKRLPSEKDGQVLVTKRSEVRIATYSEFSDTWYIGEMYAVGGEDPIAWMPLPKPYREDGDPDEAD